MSESPYGLNETRVTRVAGLRARLLGRLGIGRDVQLEPAERIRAPLPEGYHYVDPHSVTRRQEAGLKRLAGWDVTPGRIRQIDKAMEARGVSTLKVAVARNSDSKLAGFGGIMYKDGAGEFGDFVVHPDDRGLGMGRAIIDERLAMAEGAGIDSLYIPYLEDANHLRTYYLEAGFHETPAGEIVRGANPTSITGIPPKQPAPVA